MRMVDIIAKKRDRQELSREEIQYFIGAYTRGEIPDYQASAWLMAVLLNGMTDRETTDLTLAMVHSGDVLDLAGVVPVAVDKHSTGGVGDKTTLVVEPLVAACGLPVGKMSGRGLGFSGGTLDKLESIPGFRVNLSIDEFLHQLSTIGLALTGQTANLAPADGKLYALRDVTATVPSIPLIASSVMSKKIAAGATAIVLDVKCGSGAFMKTLDEARRLAELMVAIARLAGRKAVALLSDMSQPLGCAVGNVLEVREAIDTLHGRGPDDFRAHCLEVAAQMLALAGSAPDLDQARERVEEALDQGRAWDKFETLVAAQGGDVEAVRHPERLAHASFIRQMFATRPGFVSRLDAQRVGEAVMHLGGGRAKKGDPVDHAVGVEVLRKVGDWVGRDEPLMTIHANRVEDLDAAEERLWQALEWSEKPARPIPLFYGVVPGPAEA
jgi:pyrimidine-nucleoside phosphorylase